MSITDKVLARYGMKWELWPYRIVNKHGVIVQKASFDLRDCALKAQAEIGKERPIFEKTGLDTLAE